MSKKRETVPLTPEQSALAERHLALSFWVLKKYPRLAEALGEDGPGVAQAALVEAAGRFDPDFGTTFSTFATHWIRGKLMIASKLTALIHKKSWHDGPAAVVPVVPLESFVRNDEGGSDWEKTVGKEDDPPPLDGDEAVVLREALDLLPPRTATILRRRFFEGRSLESAGAEFGITRGRAQQIQEDGLAELRRLLRTDLAGLHLTGEPATRRLTTRPTKGTGDMGESATAVIERRVAELEAERAMIEAKLAELRAVLTALQPEEKKAATGVKTSQKSPAAASPRDVAADARKVAAHLRGSGPTRFKEILKAVRGFDPASLRPALEHDGWFAQDGSGAWELTQRGRQASADE